jgi:hypothetical protein
VQFQVSIKPLFSPPSLVLPIALDIIIVLEVGFDPRDRIEGDHNGSEYYEQIRNQRKPAEARVVRDLVEVCKELEVVDFSEWTGVKIMKRADGKPAQLVWSYYDRL